MQTIKNQGGELVITVDCGAVSFEPLAFASEIGLEVIVVDHHLGGSELPKAVAVVNPNRLDETSKYTNLAAVGVCYLLVIAIARTLPDDRKQNIDLMSLLDLVALGTVCDVMKLTGLNRVLVSQGLKIMARRQNLGLKTLADSAGVDDKMTSYHLGFVLGPRINAGGRVGQSYLGSKLLSTHDVVEAMQITQKLNQYNDERKAIEVLVQEEALMQAVENDEPVMMVASENWHQGVIGIVASRLKEKYNLPTAVISITNGIGKASCRSVNGVDFGAAVANAKAKGLILEGGGHTMAAGFSVAEEKITELKQYFIECFKDGVDAYLNQRSVKLDGILSVASLNEQLVNNVDQLAPFGTGNHTPKFVIANCRVVKIDLVGENHLRCILADNLNRHISVKAMAFRAAESKIGDMLYSSIGKDINIAGQAKLNHWQGRTSVDIMIDDVCIG
jgi:single-stranded-DNA-specific exonuclease